LNTLKNGLKPDWHDKLHKLNGVLTMTMGMLTISTGIFKSNFL